MFPDSKDYLTIGNTKIILVKSPQNIVNQLRHVSHLFQNANFKIVISHSECLSKLANYSHWKKLPQLSFHCYCYRNQLSFTIFKDLKNIFIFLQIPYLWNESYILKKFSMLLNGPEILF